MTKPTRVERKQPLLIRSKNYTQFSYARETKTHIRNTQQLLLNSRKQKKDITDIHCILDYEENNIMKKEADNT